MTLVAVSKGFPAHDISAAIACGQRVFGESYVQEALDKKAELDGGSGVRDGPDVRLEWHLLGPIQSNKTRAVAEHFDWVHSIDRLRIAERLSDQRPKALGPLNVCVQVNISGEPSKSGVAPEQLAALAQAVNRLPGVRLRGLMAIPAPEPDPLLQRHTLGRMRRLLDELQRLGLGCRELSMGMSGDLEAAIAEGATLVRVGTAIFGARHAA